MRGRRAFPTSTVPRKPQQQKMRICSIAKGPLKERAFLLAYEMASGNLKHCARVGRDQGGSIKGANVFSFNPRARVGRDAGMEGDAAGDASFNPRARVGARLLQRAGPARGPEVSIHAPARGATQAGATCGPEAKSFNPRARAGRDGFGVDGIFLRIQFQSTRPRGARRHRGGRRNPRRHVSIHAPARGATGRQG